MSTRETFKHAFDEPSIIAGQPFPYSITVNGITAEVTVPDGYDPDLHTLDLSILDNFGSDNQTISVRLSPKRRDEGRSILWHMRQGTNNVSIVRAR